MSNNTINYTVVIVIYNKSVAESITCECLRKISNKSMDILVVDNSEKDFNNRNECAILDYRYISMGGNKGLSKAYNVAVSAVNSDIIIFMDDDTEISEDYFEKLDDAVRYHMDVDIFAPIVYGQNGVIYSPNEYNFLRNKLISDPRQEIDQSKFNAIASCLAVRKRVFDNYRFNEMLFVDQVDQFFCYEQRQIGRRFVKLDTVIHQNFYQRGAAITAESAWRRVRIRIIDIMQQSQLMGGIRYRLLGLLKCCGLSIQISIKSTSFWVLVKGGLLSCRLFLGLKI